MSTDLSDAMTDLVAAVRAGEDLAAAAAAIAPDYRLHPDLLVRKFHEAYPCGLHPLASPERMAEIEGHLIERSIYDSIGLKVTIDQFDEATRRALRKVCGL